MVLVKFDQAKETRLTTDASLYAIGAVLEQFCEGDVLAVGGWRPIAFYSRCLNKAEAKYSATKR